MKSIDPTSVKDSDFHKTVQSVLQRWLLNPEFTVDWLRSWYWERRSADPMAVDTIASGYRATDAEMFATYLIDRSIVFGLIGMSCLHIGAEPVKGFKANLDILNSVDCNSRLGLAQLFARKAPGKRMSLDVRGALPFCFRGEGELRSVDRVVLYTDTCMLMSIGPDTACNTLRSLASGFAVGRWPSGTSEITALVPDLEFTDFIGRTGFTLIKTSPD